MHLLLATAAVDPEIFWLRPDYVAVLVTATGLTPGPSDADSESVLAPAEADAAALLARQPVEEIEPIAQWREAYRAFGAKPQRTRPSVEALLRRAPDGLPRVDRLTDVYNAISISHLLPLGGEDAARYVGAPRLVRALGDEPFDTVADGIDAVEHPDAGEVIWRDDAGVTCRRWNWRQGRRTRITTTTTQAVFVLDALDPIGEGGAHAAADELVTRLGALNPGARFDRRTLLASSPG